MKPSDSLDVRLADLVADAGLPPGKHGLHFDIEAAESLLPRLVEDAQQMLEGAAPSPLPQMPQRAIALDAMIDELEESVPPATVEAPPGANNSETLAPHSAANSRPPPLPFDPMAEAVSSAALRARTVDSSPPPVPIEPIDLDPEFELSEDDLIELEPTEEPPIRLSIAELLEDD